MVEVFSKVCLSFLVCMHILLPWRRNTDYFRTPVLSFLILMQISIDVLSNRLMP